MATDDEMEVIVIDNGSQNIKAGYSGEDAPRSVFRSLLGSVAPDSENGTRSQTDHPKDFYVGNEAQEHREMLNLQSPIQGGFVTDWDAMEKLWEYTFDKELQISPEANNMPVLLTDAPLNPKVNRERMAQIMFETFKVPGFYIATQAVLSLYASGRTRGIVVESGADVSHAVPIFEGYALPHAILRLEMGGVDISDFLHHSFQQKSVNGTDGITLSHEIVKDIKEKLCYVAPQNLAAEKNQPQSEKPYELPDGQIISIGRQDRVVAPEALFEPSMLGGDHAAHGSDGIAVICHNAISKCDLDLQQDLYGAVVLAGGTSMLPGFGDRMFNELTSRAPDGTRIRMIPDLQGRERGYNSQRKQAAWIGGSMFASLPTFGQIQITKQEWEDCHESIVHRKCF